MMRCQVVITMISVCIVSAFSQPADTVADSLKQLRNMKAPVSFPGAADYVRYCACCHGTEGAGDGMNAYNLKIRPRDFTDSAAMKGKTLPALAAVVRTGGAKSGLSDDMPSWGTTLDSMQVRALVQFIQHFLMR